MSAAPGATLRAMGMEVSVASWNVFRGLHHTVRPRARTINDELLNNLAALDADVLVLPEIWRFAEPEATLAEDVACALGYQLHQWISDRPSRSRGRVPWRIGVLTRIPARTLEPSVMPALGPFGSRAAVRVHLTSVDLTIAGLHLYGIHLLLKRHPQDWLRERALLRRIAVGHDIVAGDLNMWSPIVNRDTPTLRPAVKGRTFPSSRPHSQIDHILVNDRIEVLQSERLPDGGSDHRALRVRLRRVADSPD